LPQAVWITSGGLWIYKAILHKNRGIYGKFIQEMIYWREIFEKEGLL